MLNAAGLLDESVAIVRAGGAAPEEVSRHEATVSHALMLLLTDVLNPLFAQHPDLKPKEWA